LGEADFFGTDNESIEEENVSGEWKPAESILECPVEFWLRDSAGASLIKGEGIIKLGHETFMVQGRFDQAFTFTYREVVTVKATDYQIQMKLSSTETLTVFNLGYRYEDFCRDFHQLRNEIIIKDMLMKEKLRYPGLKVEFSYLDEQGHETDKGSCELRLYETALMVVPTASEIIRTLYRDFKNTETADYRITITTEYGENLIFSMLGKMFDPFVRDFQGMMNELREKAQSFIMDVLPGVESSIVRKLSGLIKEGKAFQKNAVEKIDPHFWNRLEKRLEQAGIKNEYDFLKALSVAERIQIGFKRGLWGDLSGYYLWFLIPIYSLNPAHPGNIVAMEAVSEEGQKKATYFFKIVNRSEYRNFSSQEALDQKVAQFLQRINYCLSAVNFRREPIYLNEAELIKPENLSYRLAIQKIPALRSLRDCFVGRIIHSSFRQWSEDVTDLLQFNVSVSDEDVKWGKNQKS
jgi:hypothetical protein